MQGKAKALSAGDIVAIVGHVDSAVVAAIRDTGATASEVAEAKRLASKTDQPIPPPAAGRTPIIHKVYDLLRAGLPDPEETAR
jgi:hypothetical protein